MININDDFGLEKDIIYKLMHKKCGRLVQREPFFDEFLYTVCGCNFLLTVETINKINFIIGAK